MDITLSPRQLRDLIPVMMDADTSLMVWGAPGVGKTEIVAAAAAEAGRTLHTLPLSAMNAVDVHGAPVITTEEDGARFLEFIAPKLLPREGDAPSVLHLDELPSAPPALQPVCYSLLWGRQVGSYRVPDNCYVMAAGNRLSDRALAHRLSSALALRMCHVTLEPALKDTLDYGVANGWPGEILAYLMHKPEYLCAFDPQQKVSPVPRQWSQVATALHHRDRLNGTMPAVICGLIGVPVGSEFISYLDVLKSVVSPAECLLNPGGVQIPGEASTRLMVALSVARATDAATMPQCMTFLSRLPAELEALGAKALSIRAECTATRAWAQWCANNPNIFAKP